MKFYMTPGSCTTGIHILLEELQLSFEVYLVNLLAGDQNQADYLAINPKGTIPTLVLDDGKVLTEFQSIAYWLARTHPKAALLPGEPYADSRVLGLMSYIVGTIHQQGFTRIFTTETYSTQPDDFKLIRQQGERIVAQGLRIINDQFSPSEYLAEQFCIADAALFNVEFWADKLQLPLPENCQRHYRRMLTRPAVRQVLREEGYSLPKE